SAAHFARTFCLFLLTKYKEAIADCDNAINSNPRLLEAYIIRGLSKFHSGDRKAAFADAAKVVALAPDYENGYLTTAALYYWDNNYDQSIAQFSKYIKSNPRNAVVLAQRAQVYTDLGQQKKAIEDLNRAIELEPKNYQYYLSRGELLQGLQMPKRAI